MIEARSALKNQENKQTYVQKMFSSCAKRYDIINSILSVRMHHSWKRRAISFANLKAGNKALDICCGTQDMAIQIAKTVGRNVSVTATDLNPDMLKIGDDKVAKLGLSHQIKSYIANAQSLPFSDNEFDAATIAFGIRNVDNIARAFAEIKRVLKPGGTLVCLEFSKPLSFPFKIVYDFYSFIILPVLGQIISGDTMGTYCYLPASIRQFPNQKKLKIIIEEAGFFNVNFHNLCGGIVAIHVGTKEKTPSLVFNRSFQKPLRKKVFA